MAGFLERLSRRLDLPAEVVAGVPRVTVTGAGQVLVENHRGILSYTGGEVRAAGKPVGVCIRGEGLLLGAMDSKMLLVTGRILEISLEETHGNL